MPALNRSATRPSRAFKSVHWMLLAVLVLVPAFVFAQQDNSSQSQTQRDQGQPVGADRAPEATQPKTEEAQKQTEGAQAQTGEDGKLISVPGGKALGMSILGNQEAPKALVIVPWKSSELGNIVGISTMLDDSRLPVDKEVFMRMLSYHEIRSETASPAGTPTKTNAAQPAAAAQGRKQ